MAFRCLLVVSLTAWTSVVHAAPIGDCTGTPKIAISELPTPLGTWGQIECTPYGHVISAKQGWIWSEPGGYRPVFVPSQMVHDNPSEVGNQSYFSSIKMTRVDGAEFADAYGTFNEGMAPSEKPPTGYRLDVVSSSGRALKLYFFDYGTHAWGIWCSEKCDKSSSFMLLNVAQRP